MIDRSSTFAPAPRWTLRFWRWRHRTRFLAGLVIAMVVWGATDVRYRARVDPNNLTLHRTDFTVYTEAGAAFFDGRDPYAVTNPRGWGYLYPPLFAMLVAPLHALDMQTQVVVWFTISVLLAWGCFRECVRINRALVPGGQTTAIFGPLPSWIGWCAVAAATLPALNCLQRGQVGILKLYLLLLGFRLLVERPSTRRALAAGGVWAMPIVLKVTPLVTIGYVLLAQLVADLRRRRLALASPGGSCAAGTVLGLVVCLLVVPSLLIGWRANLHHLQTWSRATAKNAQRSTEGELAGDSYSVRNQSLSNAVCRLGNWVHYRFAGGPPDAGGAPDAEGKRGLIMERPIVAEVLRSVCLLEALLLAVATCRVASSYDQRNLAATFGMACVSTLVVAPIARGHYYVLMLPGVMYLVPWLSGHGKRRLAIAMAVVPVVLVTAHYIDMRAIGGVGLLGIGTAVWFTVGAIAMIILGPLGAVRDVPLEVDRAAKLSGPHVMETLSARARLASSDQR